MFLISILLITTLILSGNCDQRSLIFVFDTTGSMAPDLEQLKDATIKITEEFSRLPRNPIYNYVLAEFNDPGYGPVHITSDPESIKASLKKIQIKGGGDCPEKALSGIMTALEKKDIKKPIVIVVTDATSNDGVDIFKRVTDLVETTQAQVNFLITQNTHCPVSEADPLFEEIARSSGGLVYSMAKKDVSEVVSSLKLSLQEGNVLLATIFYDVGGSHVNPLQIDETMSRFIVTLTGSDPHISILGPNNRSDVDTTRVLSLGNILVVQINDPVGGMYYLSTSSTSKHSAKIEGISDLVLSHGFSLMTPDAVADTSLLPILNAENYLSIFVSNLKAISALESAYLKTRQGNVTLKLRPIDKAGNSFFITDSFLPPNEPFKIIVVGTDLRGNRFQRVITNEVRPTRKILPVVKITKNAEKYFEGDSIHLDCSVDHIGAVRIVWKTPDGNECDSLDADVTEKTSILQHIITDAMADHSYIYICHAANEYGQVAAETRITILPLPIVRIKKIPQKALEHSNALIECTIENLNEPTTVSWYFNGGFLSKANALPINALPLNDIRREQTGEYKCAISFMGMSYSKTARLKVIYAPIIHIYPSEDTTIQAKADLSLKCIVTSPEPVTIKWMFQGSVKEESKTTDNLIYEKKAVTVHDAGKYTCEGKNSAGTNISSVEVTVREQPPEVSLSVIDDTIIEGSDTELVCDVQNVDGTALIVWYHNGKQVNKHLFSGLSKLKLSKMKRSEGGEYTCEVMYNGKPPVIDKINILVIYEPSITIAGGNSIDVQETGDLHLLCEVDSALPVHIKWVFEFDIKKETLSAGYKLELNIVNVPIAAKGYYYCEASDPRFKTIRASINVNVRELPPVIVTLTANTVSVKENDNSVQLNCEIENIREKYTIAWFLNNQPIDLNKGKTKLGPDSKTLTINDMNRHQSGVYKCRVNYSGHSREASKEIKVRSPPNLKVQTDLVIIDEDDKLEITCFNIIDAFQEPVVLMWKFGGKTIKASTTSNVKYEVNKVKLENAGTYDCVTNNIEFPVSERTTVDIVPRPLITVPDKVEALANVLTRITLLECTVTNIRGAVDIYWQFNGKNLTKHKAYPDGKLKMLALQPDDAGSYTCNFLYRNKKYEKSVPLIVLYPPRLRIVAKDNLIQIREKDKLSLTCHIDSPVPVSNVIWYHNNKKKTETKDLESFESEYIIENALLSDAGLYECSVSTKYGSAKETIDIQVMSPLTAEILPNTLIVKKKDVAQFECFVKNSFGDVTYKWFLDTKRLKGANSSILVLSDISKTDAGKYRCVVRDFKTKAQTFAILTIEASADKKPIIQDFEQSTVVINEGDDIEIKCRCESCRPLTNYEWVTPKRTSRMKTKDSFDNIGFELIESHADSMSYSLRILKARPENAGSYTCKLANSLGKDEKSILVNVNEIGKTSKRHIKCESNQPSFKYLALKNYNQEHIRIAAKKTAKNYLKQTPLEGRLYSCTKYGFAKPNNPQNNWEHDLLVLHREISHALADTTSKIHCNLKTVPANLFDPGRPFYKKKAMLSLEKSELFYCLQDRNMYQILYTMSRDNLRYVKMPDLIQITENTEVSFSCAGQPRQIGPLHCPSAYALDYVNRFSINFEY